MAGSGPQTQSKQGLAGVRQLLALGRYDLWLYPFLVIGTWQLPEKYGRGRVPPPPTVGRDSKDHTHSLPSWVLRPVSTHTSIAFIYADIKVAAEGRHVDDAVGDKVVGRGVFICGLEGTAKSRPPR